MGRAGLPFARAGRTIGLLGGSFDPAHLGHLTISETALHRFALDQVWWLVSPGNPLKDKGPAPLDKRLRAARDLVKHPGILVTDLETRIETTYTADTLERIAKLYPGVHFVWLMGADNLRQIHLWKNWRRIFETMPVGVLARPGQRLATPMPRAARVFRARQIPPNRSRLLARAQVPGWCYINLPMSPLSSTAIREKGGWN